MAWIPLTKHMTWEKAHEIADRHPLTCVSLRQPYRRSGSIQRQPVVFRRQAGNWWYNYFEDNTYRRTPTLSDGYEPESYVPYLYIPDKIRYIDFLSFAKQHILPLKHTYHTFFRYLTTSGDEFVYDMFQGIAMFPVVMFAFDNPLLYYEASRIYERKGVQDPDTRSPTDIRNEQRYKPRDRFGH